MSGFPQPGLSRSPIPFSDDGAGAWTRKDQGGEGSRWSLVLIKKSGGIRFRRDRLDIN